MPSPDAQPEVVVYSTPMCIPCDELKAHLATHDVPFTLVDVLIDEDAADMLEDAGIHSSPAISIGGELFAGTDAERVNALLKIES
ncbi:MAG TPA: glutaredoxin family protein [Dehalococcoidia bacterium]|jgi:glutaredoxin-like protein NrdH|nr:glutaredoxin family protein [Dehalococcoidia bacterium]